MIFTSADSNPQPSSGNRERTVLEPADEKRSAYESASPAQTPDQQAISPASIRRAAWFLASATLLFLAVWLAPAQLTATKLASYVPLHTFMETFAIVVSMLIFGVAWNAYSGDRPGSVLILACGFLAVGLIDFAHVMSFPGMPDFIGPAELEKTINFWLAARFLAALTLLLIALRRWEPIPSCAARNLLLAGGIALAALVYWIVLYHADLLPRTFLAGKGLTPFKIAAEYSILAVFATAAWLFLRQARRSGSLTALWLFAACTLSALSELCFTLFSDVADLFNLLGHVYKIAAYGLVYRAVFVDAVQRPFASLSRARQELEQAADELRRLNAGLEQRVAERTAKLDEVNENLRDSGARVQSIFDTVVDGIITIDERGIVANVNPAAERIFGYTAAAMIGKNIKMLMPEPYHSGHDGYLERYHTTAEARVIGIGREVAGRRQDGSTFPLDLAVSEMWLGDKRHYTGIVRDITERKRAEDELVRQSNKLAAIMENFPGGISLFDADLRLVTHNQQFRKLLDFPDALFQKPDLCYEDVVRYNAQRGDYGPGDAEQQVAERVQSARKFQPHRFERERPNGTVLDIQGVPLPSGGFVTIYLDITERRHIEAELADQRRRLSDIIEGTNAGTLEWNVQTGAMVIDERWANIIGFSLAELMPMTNDLCVELVHPDDLKQSNESVRAHFAGQSDYHVCELRLRHKDGHWVWVLDMGRVSSRTADGQPLLMSGTRQDISVQKATQAQLAAAHLQAQAATLAKTAFLANMSHEIRSPLNAILGLAYLLEQSSLDPDAKAMVGKIRSSGRTLLSLISDILDMSKIEGGQMVLEQAPFDLETVVDNVAMALGLAIGDKDIELIVSPLPAGVHTIMGDATRLQQVLVNLVGNAAKFTQAGRIELRIEMPGRTDETDWLRFSVHDTGIGIAPELQSGVFDAFAQADTSTTRRFGGTGLGLSISRQLVGLMSGELGLNSVPGQGSEFWFTLPLQRVEAAQDSAQSLTELDVLIVDDSEVSLQALGTVAQHLGWRASKVDSGAAAVANVFQGASRNYPDVVVLDWKMPGMDGLAVARAIRARTSQSECPIVIMATAHSLTTLAGQDGAELVDAILSKPVTASALKHAVLQAQRHRGAPQGSSNTVLSTGSSLLAGVRLLVVDDVDINREVARRILSGHGATVTLAEDGQQALDWLLAHPLDVDLVLMDVQMPVLDGIEATRRLRRLPEFDDLPIVALTAGAFESQREEATAAGMTAFVSKPFDVALTVDLIRRLRRPAKLSTATPAGAALMATVTPARVPAPVASAPAAVMDAAQGLALWSDLPSYQTYLRRFADSYCDAVAALRAHLASSDRPGAAALAHKLSGVAANLALPDTRRAAQEAERVLGTQDDPELALADLSRALTAVLAEINRYAPPIEPANETPGVAGVAAPAWSAAEQVALKKQLSQLLLALDSDNPALVKKEMTTLEQQLPAAALAAIGVSVLDYDFRGAETRTRQLAADHGVNLGD